MSEITVTGRPQNCAAWKRYYLSNGWFIDGATKHYAYLGDHKYTLYEPGGHPSGCAGLRGSAPTLKLAVAIANGHQPCGGAVYSGCRKLAIGYHNVTVRGHEGRVYYCEDHAPVPEIPSKQPRQVAGTVTVAVTERQPLALTRGTS